jgi:ribokinase
MVIQSDRLPKPGETVMGGHFLMNAGGKGANQAVAAARLNGHVYFVANVGNDVFGQRAIEQFVKEEINTDFISTDTIHPSGVALINVDANGENSITVAPGANGYLTPHMLASVFGQIKPRDLVLVQLEIPMATIEYIAQQCSRQSIRIILNPAPALPLSNELIEKIFLITPNERETEFLTGISLGEPASIKKAAECLHQKGIANVIITLGKRGAYWSSGTGSGFVEALDLKAVDTTAAGDCFNGGLAVALAENKSLEDAARFACKAASLAVTKVGAQASMPTLQELAMLSLKKNY